ncbi:MAG: extracellular solute-binding protein [Clostridia bacterium]|nr:extracellular solute-binding protein [Clostridia bacterium]
MPGEGDQDSVREVYLADKLLLGGESAQRFASAPEGEEKSWQSLYLYDPASLDEIDTFPLKAGITSLSFVSEADQGDLIIRDIVLEKKQSDIPYTAFDYSGEAIDIDVTNISESQVRDGSPADETVSVVTEDGEKSIYQPDGSSVSWKVNVPESGFYNILLRYKTTSSRGVDIERTLLIDGKVPFAGATMLTFNRLWTDDPTSKNPDGTYRRDNQGNEIRPSQIEIFDWQEAYFKDSMGYVVEPYRFWLEAGERTLTLVADNEPMIISRLSITPIVQHKTYTEYAATNAEQSGAAPANTLITLQGEDAYLRSSPSLYPRYDRSSPATVPSSIDKTVLNYIGGDPWNTSGQWIEWEFTVPEDGYYNITIKARQQYQRGSISCRSVYIDGAIPFDELSSIAFSYDTAWQMYTLGDKDGNAYRFYLTKDKPHTIRLEATLGEMGTILSQMEDSIDRLNRIYRDLLKLTGVNPDRFRDYNIPANIPNAIPAMAKESQRLYKLVDDTVAITGQKSDRIAVAQTLAVQMEGFVARNERITQSFSNFKDNITSLGTSLQNMSESKLDVDMIIVSSPDAKLPKVHDGGAYKAWHEIKSCVASYFVDYDSLGNKYDEDSEEHMIQVWIVTGRDQSTVLKTMVDDMFTDKTGIKVNVKLVGADALLTAVVAGNGPDVVLSVDSWFAVNYAMRHAVEDLTQFDDFDTVAASFMDSAIVPLSYNDGSHTGVYGLPETQVFSMLFYREDILNDLGLAVPETWDDLIAMLPTIQGNNMTVGIPYPDISNPDMSVFNSLIYQNGGSIYDDEAKHTLIDSEAGVSAFKLYTSFFNNYGLPTVYDFVSRFRSGEMPLGISPYTTYNTLAVSAPEIRNLWNFTLIPGTVVTDENENPVLDENGQSVIDKSVHANGVCCMMIATDDETVKNDSWEFMKWWVSKDAQVRFGREMESILGASARYATANTEAIRELAWSSEQLEKLQAEQAWAVGFREIAGGYSTTRHMTNAVRRVINMKEDPRETLLTYARTINEEIAIKRQEFNLPVD